MLDVVDELDLSGFYERYRSDGLGRAAYAPSVMVAVVLYAYCVGERSSRRIERRCGEDIAFRVLSANQVPDHATIARFVAGHEAAFSALFCQVLALCAAAGLVKLGVIALDGTQIAANASGQANRTREGLDVEAKRIVAEAIATDKAEDARYGDARGAQHSSTDCRSADATRLPPSTTLPPRAPLSLAQWFAALLDVEVVALHVSEDGDGLTAHATADSAGVNFELRDGEPVPTIRDAAADSEARAIAIGARGPSVPIHTARTATLGVRRTLVTCARGRPALPFPDCTGDDG